MNRVQLKSGDREPPVTVAVTDSDDRPLDLSTVDFVTFTMVRVGSVTPTILDQPAEILGPGRLRYNWADGDTDEPGRYVAEFKIAWSNGAVTMRIPAKGYIQVDVAQSMS